MVDDVEQIRQSLDEPIYIGWGSLYKKKCFKERAQLLFDIVAPRNPYLNPKMEENRFVHPDSLQRYAKNTKSSELERKRFFSQTYETRNP